MSITLVADHLAAVVFLHKLGVGEGSRMGRPRLCSKCRVISSATLLKRKSCRNNIDQVVMKITNVSASLEATILGEQETDW